MAQSTVFKSNKSQAVRLPKAVALPDSVKRVDIVKLGGARLISPADTAWDSFFEGAEVSRNLWRSVCNPRSRTGRRFSAALHA